MSREAKAWTQQAAAHYAAGQYREAVDTLLRVLQREPTNAAAASLAEIEIYHSQYGVAIGRLLGLQRARPHFGPAIRALGRACLMSNRLDEALVHARTACAQDPAEPGHRLLLARLQIALG